MENLDRPKRATWKFSSDNKYAVLPDILVTLITSVSFYAGQNISSGTFLKYFSNLQYFPIYVHS
ncbi:MAG: hypothetical protein GF353_22180 [Candidatus Lokiarchaeota archaeon]|nr:hypothetical protein [Candidatus Lokiarchaeota archaeon]